MCAPLLKERVCLLFVTSQSAVCSICRIFNSTRAFWKPCSAPYASSSKWHSPDADREIKRKMEHQSERRYRTDVHRNVDFVWPLSLTLPSSGKVSDGRGENKEGREEETSEGKQRGGTGKAALLVELSGSVGRRGVRWQESGTATQLCFGVEGPPEIGVTVFHCHGEEREGNTRDVVMYRQRQRRRIGVRRGRKNDSKRSDRPWSSCSYITWWCGREGRKKKKGPHVGNQGQVNRGTGEVKPGWIAGWPVERTLSFRPEGKGKTTFPMIQLLLRCKATLTSLRSVWQFCLPPHNKSPFLELYNFRRDPEEFTASHYFILTGW